MPFWASLKALRALLCWELSVRFQVESRYAERKIGNPKNDWIDYLLKT